MDAVEIDPVIAELGRRFHPARPYADPRVNLVVGDGRAFLTRAAGKYDLIVFALTDSLVKVSPMAQLRLENYLFTEECIRRAHALLNEGGDLLFYNFYRQPWVRAKIELMVQRATGHYPRELFSRRDFVMMAAGLHNQGEGKGGLSTKLAFALMGVAFLLLETRASSPSASSSEPPGSTTRSSSWASWSWSSPRTGHRRDSGAGASGSSSLRCSAPVSSPSYTLSRRLLTFEDPLLRFAAASLLTFSPIFFANVLFGVAFRDQEVPEHVFGWNLIGATLGAVLEYTSLSFGYNALVLLVVLCYTAAFAALLAPSRVPRPLRA